MGLGSSCPKSWGAAGFLRGKHRVQTWRVGGSLRAVQFDLLEGEVYFILNAANHIPLGACFHAPDIIVRVGDVEGFAILHQPHQAVEHGGIDEEQFAGGEFYAGGSAGGLRESLHGVLSERVWAGD